MALHVYVWYLGVSFSVFETFCTNIGEIIFHDLLISSRARKSAVISFIAKEVKLRFLSGFWKIFFSSICS